MQARMPHPVMTIPGLYPALMKVSGSIQAVGLGESLSELVHLRASQINGCSVCTEMHARGLQKAGEPDERIWAVGAWRESPHFTEAERAALELTEVLTRVADKGDAVPDDVWNEAAKHYDEAQLSALVMEIAVINLWNRVNAATRQVGGSV